MFKLSMTYSLLTRSYNSYHLSATLYYDYVYVIFPIKLNIGLSYIFTFWSLSACCRELFKILMKHGVMEKNTGQAFCTGSLDLKISFGSSHHTSCQPHYPTPTSTCSTHIFWTCLPSWYILVSFLCGKILQDSDDNTLDGMYCFSPEDYFYVDCPILPTSGKILSQDSNQVQSILYFLHWVFLRPSFSLGLHLGLRILSNGKLRW